MIKFFSDRYRLYRRDQFNLVLQKRYTKVEKERKGKKIGGGEGWKGVGPYHASVTDALRAMIEDMLMDNVGDDSRVVEAEKFKHNIIKLKKLVMSQMDETVQQYLAMERGELEEDGETEDEFDDE